MEQFLDLVLELVLELVLVLVLEPNGFKFIRISSHTPKNIQEGIAEMICEDSDILSHCNPPYTSF